MIPASETLLGETTEMPAPELIEFEAPSHSTLRQKPPIQGHRREVASHTPCLPPVSGTKRVDQQDYLSYSHLVALHKEVSA